MARIQTRKRPRKFVSEPIPPPTLFSAATPSEEAEGNITEHYGGNHTWYQQQHLGGTMPTSQGNINALSYDGGNADSTNIMLRKRHRKLSGLVTSEQQHQQPRKSRDPQGKNLVLPMDGVKLSPNFYELISTFDGSNGSFGAMFDITAKDFESDDIRLRIDSLDIHANVKEPCSVLVYILKEKGVSHVGHETNPDVWSLMTNTTVQCEGFYKRTHVPLDALLADGSYDDRLILESGQTMAFYVMMNDPFLRYTVTNNFEEVYSSTDHLMFYEGTGIGDWWGGDKGEFVYRPRVWNGSIRYELLQPSENNDMEEINYSIQNDGPTCSKQIATPYTSDTGSYGNMFNVQTKSKAITITGMSLYTDRTTDIVYEIHSRRDSFSQNGMVGLDNWHLIASGSVTGAGSGVGTRIPSEHFLRSGSERGDQNIDLRTIPANTTQAFYVTLTTNDMNYEKSSLKEGDAMISNDDIDVLVGVGVADYPPGPTFYGLREWRGGIEYDIHETCEPTKAPTSMPSFSPTTQSLPSSPSLETTVVTTVTFIFNLEYDPSKVSSTMLFTVVDEIVGSTVDSLIARDDQLEIYVLFYKLNVRKIFSAEDLNAESKVQYPCVAAAMPNVCTAVKTVIELEHNSKLSSDTIRYEFLSRRGDFEDSLDGLFDVTYVGEQTVEAKAEIVLNGVPAKEMGNDEIKFFESTAKRFLNDVMRSSPQTNSGVKILTVSVEEQELDGEENYKRVQKGTPQGRQRPYNDGQVKTLNGSGRRLQASSSSIGIGTIITCQYQPPPEINFPRLVLDSIDTGGDKLVDELINPPNGSESGGSPAGASYFENVKKVTIALPPTTISPTTAPISTEADKSVWSSAVPMAVLIGSGVLIIAATVLIFLILRRKKSKKARGNSMDKEIKNLFIDTEKRNRQGSLRSQVLMRDSNEDLISKAEEMLGQPRRDDFTIDTESSHSSAPQSVRNFRSTLASVAEAGDEEECSSHGSRPKRRGVPRSDNQRILRHSRNTAMDDHSTVVSELTWNTGSLAGRSKASHFNRQSTDDQSAAISALTWDTRTSKGIRTI